MVNTDFIEELNKLNVFSKQHLLLLAHGIKPMVTINRKESHASLVEKHFLTKTEAYNSPRSGRTQYFLIAFADKDSFDKHTQYTDLGQSRKVDELFGYPPVAIDYFYDEHLNNVVAEKMSGKPSTKSVGLDYHGIRFVCRRGDEDLCIKWMEDNRPVPVELQRGIVIIDDLNKRTKED